MTIYPDCFAPLAMATKMNGKQRFIFFVLKYLFCQKIPVANSLLFDAFYVILFEALKHTPAELLKKCSKTAEELFMIMKPAEDKNY